MYFRPGEDLLVADDMQADSFRHLLVKGSFSAYLETSALHTLFLNETETTLISILAAARTPSADIVGFSMPRIKIQGSAPDDGEKPAIRTYQFTALYDYTGGAGTDSDKSTISVQDSLA